MTNADDALTALHDLRGTLLALECVTRAVKRVHLQGHSKKLENVIQQETEATWVSLLYKPVPERVLKAFEREAGKFVSLRRRKAPQA